MFRRAPKPEPPRRYFCDICGAAATDDGRRCKRHASSVVKKRDEVRGDYETRA